MTFTNPAPLGGYVTGNQITESEINYWCSVLPDAIDGAQGGTYTLANPLVINGDDLTIGEDLSVGGRATVTGDVSVGDDLTVGDNATIGGNVSIGGTLDVTSDLTVGGETILDSNLQVTGQITSDSATIGGTFTAFGATTFPFKVNSGVNGSHAYTLTDANQIYFTEALSGSSAYTFSGSFDAGMWFIFKHRASGGATLTVNGVAHVVGQGSLWIYTGSAWRVFLMSENFA